MTTMVQKTEKRVQDKGRTRIETPRDYRRGEEDVQEILQERQLLLLPQEEDYKLHSRRRRRALCVTTTIAFCLPSLPLFLTLFPLHCPSLLNNYRQ